ncbi:hypothetical protein GCM10009766_15200 [Microcella frigidaquae]
MLRIDSARARRAIAAAVATVLMTLGAGATAAQAAPVEEAQPVTTEWVCSTMPSRVTDFRVFNGTAHTFAIQKFDAALGSFVSIEVSLDAQLTAGMQVNLNLTEPAADVTVNARYELWMNIPPEAVTPNFPPGPSDRSSTIYLPLEIPWANGPLPNGPTVFNTRVESLGGSFTSLDSGVWSGSGLQTLIFQSNTTIGATGVGGNGEYIQNTTASADLCYRYTYVPAASGPEPEPPSTPDEPTESDPAPDPEPTPETTLQELPALGAGDRFSAVLPLALGAALTILAGMMLRQRPLALGEVRPPR